MAKLLRQPSQNPKTTAIVATVPSFRRKSAATSAPETKNEIAEIAVNGAVAVRQPTRAPTSLRLMENADSVISPRGKENRILKFPSTNYYWKKIQYFEERF
jgi:hypothetical protein